ncbi:GNAT family N-acetyltransferase [Deinococcus cellulosilyticus]|uniref:N-acetyltransferase n=1 Tax=Deinococcus cellulosilyticus (strain DSM 18568 / NBRC 106333 / KACC 11606 / 5516J-15) TaxID=1223518 RepID=A0A511N4Z7_DEIC1|nr:GNAT family N-acetyltransferase [Deinococcus cellulosilyticus]GEM47526.1 N-acetyltransferase [Deinococcus cellulosilyticus NBRC 106333 = KACC 11606]
MQKTITYLEMKSPDQLKPKHHPEHVLEVRVCKHQDYRLNRFFYQWIGSAYRWTDRLPWSDEKWQEMCEQPGVHLAIVYLDHTPIGYAELWEHPQECEIKFFGLADRYIGRGLGGPALTRVIEAAWSLGAHRVFLNTCDWDHPNALKNYLARGFQVYHEETV